MNKSIQNSTSNVDRSEVVLYSEPTPGLVETRQGLALWTVLNDNEISVDPLPIKGKDADGKLRPIEWKFEKVLDWDEWKDICLPRLEYASKLEIPHIPELLPHTGKAAIVGAGPSVTNFLEDIKKFKLDPCDNLFSVNATHNWLINEGVIPRIHVIAEHDIDDVEICLGGPPHKDVVYYLASCCDQRIFKQLEGFKRVLWHHHLTLERYQQGIDKYFKGEFMVSSGYATFFKSVAIAVILGFRHFDLYGCDSSFEESSHMDGYTVANREEKMVLYGPNGRKFITQGGLVFQTREFLEFCKYNQNALRIKVHGDGLLRYVHEARYPDQYRTQGVVKC